MKHAALFSLVVMVALCSVGLAEAQSTTNLTSVLSWDNSDAMNSIQIEKGPSSDGPFSFLATVVPNTVTFIDEKNAPGEQSCYRLAYANTSGVGPYFNVACKSFPTLPTAAPSMKPIR